MTSATISTPGATTTGILRRWLTHATVARTASRVFVDVGRRYAGITRFSVVQLLLQSVKDTSEQRAQSQEYNRTKN